jgi:hypothetical protein
MLHDRLSGRTAWHCERGIVLVVDGVTLEIGDLAKILRTHEGWDFEVKIVDSVE